jgi:hypothetical protein
MKTNPLIPSLGIALLIGVASPGVSLAGQVNVDPVSVGTGFAYGGIGAAHYSSDSLQYIGCQTVSNSSASQATCWAQDASQPQPKYLSCTSTNPSIVAAARSINTTSLILFTVDSGGNCTEVVVADGSNLLY